MQRTGVAGLVKVGWTPLLNVPKAAGGSVCEMNVQSESTPSGWGRSSLNPGCALDEVVTREARNPNLRIRRTVGRCPARSVGASLEVRAMIMSVCPDSLECAGQGVHFRLPFGDHQPAVALRVPHRRAAERAYLGRACSFFLQELTTRTSRRCRTRGQVTASDAPRWHLLEPANASTVVARLHPRSRATSAALC